MVGTNLGSYVPLCNFLHQYSSFSKYHMALNPCIIALFLVAYAMKNGVHDLGQPTTASTVEITTSQLV